MKMSQQKNKHNIEPKMTTIHLLRTHGPKFITQEKFITGSDVRMYGHHKKKATKRKRALRKFPLEIICEWAGFVIDVKTGKLIEYYHLRTRTKYRNV